MEIFLRSRSANHLLCLLHPILVCLLPLVLAVPAAANMPAARLQRLLNLLVDISYAYVDPRIRLD